MRDVGIFCCGHRLSTTRIPCTAFKYGKKSCLLLSKKAGAWSNGQVSYLAWQSEGSIDGCLGFMITRVHETGDDAGARRILPTWIAFTDQSNPNWFAQEFLRVANSEFRMAGSDAQALARHDESSTTNRLSRPLRNPTGRGRRTRPQNPFPLRQPQLIRTNWAIRATMVRRDRCF